MKREMKNFTIILGSLLLGCIITGGWAHAQVGIGTSQPQARLHVYNGSFLSTVPTFDPQESPFYDPVNFDTDSVHHGLKWIQEKEAFRAVGTGILTYAFNPVNVGKYSFAAGFDAFAIGLAASAFGMRSNGTGFGSFSAGQYVTAYHDRSFAQGYFATANGPNGVTFGTNLDNNYHMGAFIMGYDSFNLGNSGNHQIRMMFEGGYRFYTSKVLISGVLLPPGANSWSVISDVRKKENFIPVNGRNVLDKIARMQLSSWNYKSQDSKAFRHYGPMAQDFFAAFGQDGAGTIGTDTTINQADLDGISLIAIQALIEETNELQRLNEDLERQLTILSMRLSANKRFKKDVMVASKKR